MRDFVRYIQIAMRLTCNARLSMFVSPWLAPHRWNPWKRLVSIGDQNNFRPWFEQPTVPCEGAVGDILVLTPLRDGQPDPTAQGQASVWFCVKASDERGQRAVWAHVLFDGVATCATGPVPLPTQLLPTDTRLRLCPCASSEQRTRSLPDRGLQEIRAWLGSRVRHFPRSPRCWPSLSAMRSSVCPGTAPASLGFHGDPQLNETTVASDGGRAGVFGASENGAGVLGYARANDMPAVFAFGGLLAIALGKEFAAEFLWSNVKVEGDILLNWSRLRRAV